MSKQTIIPIRKLYKIGLGYRGNKFFFNTSLILDEQNKTITLHYYPNLLGKLILTLILPFALLFEGLVNTKEVIQDYKKHIVKSKRNLEFCSKDQIKWKENHNNTFYNNLLSILNK